MKESSVGVGRSKKNREKQKEIRRPVKGRKQAVHHVRRYETDSNVTRLDVKGMGQSKKGKEIKVCLTVKGSNGG